MATFTDSLAILSSGTLREEKRERREEGEAVRVWETGQVGLMP